MFSVLLAVYLLTAFFIVSFILIQQGKGADIGASFGSSASNSIWGTSGRGSFLAKITSIFVAIFFILSLILGNMSANKTSKRSVLSNHQDEIVALNKDSSTDKNIDSRNNDIP
ncbi:protein-export membrane protein [Candidatus Photodesmus katoptron]|uniref:Protein-export membrane protein SecG n=1 Tax=Candidatus Photodesmus katoptron Akat1 TaxID=1236703 RepID=S3DJG5_9GAMM|nr:preprotein translocase subunit SecG [Candidatus Photodesmus katoptron]EPE37830.1 preprotein translocase, SecG subunit [Candidatus Photodesmus katoptron Akat1]KEY90451.1 protein-export membrane protein [Candidatus Photodesmus katoptron]